MSSFAGVEVAEAGPEVALAAVREAVEEVGRDGPVRPPEIADDFLWQVGLVAQSMSVGSRPSRSKRHSIGKKNVLSSSLLGNITV